MKIRTILMAVAAVAFTSSAMADTYTRGYTRSNGTYVAPHYRTSPDRNTYNNYSTRGNVNPYTGQRGTVSPSYRPRNNYNSYSYGSRSTTRSNSYGGYNSGRRSYGSRY